MKKIAFLICSLILLGSCQSTQTQIGLEEVWMIPSNHSMSTRIITIDSLGWR